MFSSQVLTALLLASFAGLATTFGALIAFFSRLENLKFLAISLGFSAGGDDLHFVYGDFAAKF